MPLFELRALTAEDLPLLHEWLNRPHVAEWWDGPVSLEQVLADFMPELDSPEVSLFLPCLDGRPVAFAQVYRVLGSFWPDETDPGARGIDQFLAEPGLLNRGLGAALVRQLVGQIFAGDSAVTRVQADPAPDNARAIRCYEKAGLRRQRVVETPDGPALLLSVTREEWSRE